MNSLRQTVLAALAMSFGTSMALAAPDAPAPPTGHAGHAGHSGAATPTAQTVQAAQAPAMNHGDMSAQGGTAPPDARDPHAYSAGTTLTAGPYAFGGRRLRLADEMVFASVLVDSLEAVRSHGSNASAYDAIAWFGRNYNRLVIKAEGEVAHGKLHEARTEVLWSHAVAPFWDMQTGVRHDSGAGPNRSWLAFGIQGLAPYWFEVDATAYVGSGGRTALRLATDYELRVTQKLIVQPRVEANLYGKSDPARELGKGLSDLTAGVRMRYELTRQFAPYVGVEWVGRFGESADLARLAGERTRSTRYVAGLRLWF